ncbi:MAG: hypothetical protein IJE60_01970 [Tyzzerella sp.]|nr:hypothetical protein [Tyzzerella sp.]
MFKYDGYVIKTTPDYKEALKKGEEIGELVCEVYAESDTEFKKCLNEFNMMQCFEYKENTVSEIENGIKNIIDSDSSYLELKVKQDKFDRQSALFYRAVEFIKESVGGDDIEMTLKLCLGMTDEEIKETLDGLNEQEESQGIEMM